MNDPEQLDRRTFLGRAGVAGLGLAAVACGGGSGPHSSTSPSATIKRATTTTTGRPPGPPLPRRLRDAIRGPVIERGSAAFAIAAHVYNERFDSVTPLAVARPLDPADVSAAVRWSAANQVPLVARSGGHSYAGYSTVADGIVLDLRELRSIAVNARGGSATVGAGAQLIDVYAALAAVGATLPAGSCPSVGIAGHALGGGMGLAGRAFGLATDNILAVDLVTADGRLRTVDRSSDPDLLWALQGGGGGNFGIATRITFAIHRTPSTAAWFFVSFPWSDAREALAAWLASAPGAMDRLTSILHLDAGAGRTSVNVAGQYLGRAADLPALLAPLTQLPAASLSSGDQDYLGLQLRWAGCLGQPLAPCHTAGTRPGGTEPRASFNAKSDYVTRPLGGGARAALIGAAEARAQQPGSGAILFDSYGGAINRIAPDTTAFVHRDSICCIQYLSYDGGGAWLEDTHRAMRPYVSGYAYQNYIDPNLSDWRHAYYGANYPRLVAVKQRVDPDRIFHFPQAVGT